MSQETIPITDSNANEPGSYDLRNQVPDLLPYLRPDERVVEVEHHADINIPRPGHISGIRELLRVAGVTRTEDAEVLIASKAKEDETRTEMKHFEKFFGRDALISSLLLWPYYPNLLRASVRKMATLQGVKYNPMSEEESGKGVHEAPESNDPIAQKITERLDWEWPYYGAVDSTPLYVSAIARVTKADPNFLATTYTDKAGHEQTFAHSLELAMGFIERHIAESPLGLLEYKRLNPNGIQNQWWADSWDSMSDRDGRVANFDQPVAAVAVQALTYDALMDAADIYRQLHTDDPKHVALATKYETMAANIKKQVFEKFWKQESEDEGYFVVGLDRDDAGIYRQLDTKTAHMGLLLESRLFDDKSTRTAVIVNQLVYSLFTDDMQNVSGLRTLSKREKRYKPGGYHTGTVWLWVNNWVANGLDRQAANYDRPDYSKKATMLREKTHAVVERFKKMPELVNGGDDPEPRLNDRRVVIAMSPSEQGENSWTPNLNTVEQLGQDFQTWTFAAYLSAKHLNNPFSERAKQK